MPWPPIQKETPTISSLIPPDLYHPPPLTHYRRKAELRSAAKKSGGAEGSRTPDLLIANETLYQLSYDPNGCEVTLTRN